MLLPSTKLSVQCYVTDCIATWLKIRYCILENKLIVTGYSGYKVTAYIHMHICKQQ